MGLLFNMGILILHVMQLEWIEETSLRFKKMLKIKVITFVSYSQAEPESEAFQAKYWLFTWNGRGST